jgi:hypothetical protein
MGRSIAEKFNHFAENRIHYMRLHKINKLKLILENYENNEKR